MYQKMIHEDKVRAQLQQRFSSRKVDQITAVAPGVWMARLIDGGLVHVIATPDGSLSVDEQDAVC